LRKERSFLYSERMPNAPLMLANYPRAIMHLDADAFFASVEEAIDPTLKGKPVVTGRERGIIACANYAAKARGITRGTSLFEAKRRCPELIILPNDYETYSLFSKRMFTIMRRYTPLVEEYSVDEAFADITGMRRLHQASYKEIAERIRDDVESDLGFTVSVGLSSTKVLAKICSKFRKPHGLTAVPGPYIHLLLQRTSVEEVWGFGPNTCNLLRQHHIHTAYDFINQPERWARRILHKPGWELWQELRGNAVLKVTPDPKATYATIMKSKTFTPPSSDKELVYGKLIRNVERAFAKARRFRLRPEGIAVVLRQGDYNHDGLEARLNRGSSATLEILPVVRTLFEKIYRPGRDYRSTMIVLGKLVSDDSEQYELFFDPLEIKTFRDATAAIDEVNRRYGRDTLVSGTALFLPQKQVVERDVGPARWESVMQGETRKRHLAIPRLNIRV